MTSDSPALHSPLWFHIPDRRTLALLVLAGILGVQTLIAANAIISYQVVDGNAAGMVQLARGCAEGHQCASQGGEGRLGLFSGASWIRLTTYSLQTHGDLSLIQSVVRGALILSAVATFFFFRRYLGLQAAAIALGLYLPLALSASDISSFDNPNLFPLPAAIYYAGTLLFTDLRKTAFSIVAALGLAAAINVYVVFLIMLPFHLAVVALLARRPVSACAASCLCVGLVFCLDSMDATRAIVGRISAVPAYAFLLLGGVGLVLAFAARAIRRTEALSSMSVSKRLRITMTAALLYHVLAIWLACFLFGIPTPPEARYFAPAVIPLLYLAAESTRSLARRAFITFAAIEILSLLLLPFAPEASVAGRTPLVLIVSLSAVGIAVSQIVRHGSDRTLRVPVVAVMLLCFSLGVSLPDIVRASPGPALGFRLSEGEPIVSSLYGAGYTYPQIAGSLQGPTADHLLPLLAAHDPQLFGKPGYLRNEEFSLLVLKVPRAAIPLTRGIIAALDVGRSRTAIVVREEHSFLDWLHAKVCPATTGEAAAASGCAQLLLEQALWRQWPYIQVGDPTVTPAGKRPYRDERDGQPTGQPTSSWSVEPDRDQRHGGERGSVRVVMPVHTPGQGVPHIIQPGGFGQQETWRIVAVHGVEFEGNLPGAQIRLLDRRQSAGIIEFEVDGVAKQHPWNWLRHFIEVTDDNAHLLALQQ